MSGRGPKFVCLPDDVVARARAMRFGTGRMSWERIAADLGVKVYRLRKSLDPEYSRQGPSTVHNTLKRSGVVVVEAPVKIPDEIAQERTRLLEYIPESLTALVMGDPPPWRSALAEKNRTQDVSEQICSP